MTTTVPVSLKPPSIPRTFDSAAKAKLKIKRIGIYTRVSTKDQLLGYGLDVQLKGVRDYIDIKKVIDPDTIWEIVDVYEDAGESGAKQDRPEIMRLERDVRDGKIDVVAVHKFDRIGRTGRAFWYWVWALEDAGVSIISVTQEIDTTTTHGTVALQNLASFSEMEWRTILERTQNGLNMKAASGGWVGGPPPYGYCVEGKGSRNSKLAVDTAEAAVLELAAKLIVEGGYTVDRTAHMLNLIGKTTRRGRDWTGSNLRHKFMNSALDGFIVFRNTDEVVNKRRRRKTVMGEDGKPKHGPTVIIDTPMALSMERLHSVRAALKRNGWRLDGPHKYHPLSKRIIGLCQKHYTGVWVKLEQRRTYRCSGGPGCGDSVIDAVAMEKVVWDSLTEFFGNKEKLRELAQTWRGNVPDYSGVYKERIAELDKEIETLDSLSTNQLLGFAKAGVDPEQVAKAMATLKDDQDKKTKLRNEAKQMLEESEKTAERAQELEKLVETATFNLKGLPDQQKAEVMELADIKVKLLGPVPLEGRFGPGADIERWFDERGVTAVEMTDELWENVRSRISFRATKNSHDLRLLVEGLLHKARTGCPWSEMPAQYPPKEALRARWRAWKDGAWADIVEPLLVPAPPRTPPLPPFEVTGNIDPRLYKFSQMLSKSQDAEVCALTPG
ncbi:recombinase family protein [Streptomyces sp. BH105]|uniref:recombinase family protein n=1 Tax=Streptomyces sp. BH105 TaxID=3410408 RepID=UPI003CFBC267